jgi:hypothetical protein
MKPFLRSIIRSDDDDEEKQNLSTIRPVEEKGMERKKRARTTLCVSSTKKKKRRSSKKNLLQTTLTQSFPANDDSDDGNKNNGKRAPLPIGWSVQRDRLSNEPFFHHLETGRIVFSIDEIYKKKTLELTSPTPNDAPSSVSFAAFPVPSFVTPVWSSSKSDPIILLEDSTDDDESNAFETQAGVIVSNHFVGRVECNVDDSSSTTESNGSSTIDPRDIFKNIVKHHNI